jgi:glycosyltransferase involved in cell wall biosynthesis
MQLRVGVDFYFGSQLNRRGIGNYSYSLYKKISNDPSVELFLFVPRSAKFRTEDFSKAKIVRLPTNLYLLNELFFVPIYAAWYRVNILHYTGNSVSPFSLLFGYKVFCTIHDTMFMNLNYKSLGGFSQYFSRLYRKITLKISINFIDAILTISEYSAEQIYRSFGRHLVSKTLVTYQGVGDDFIEYSKLPTDISQINTLQSFQNYFFSIGAIEPRKNVVGVLQAFSFFCQKQSRSYDKQDIKLIIAGIGSADIPHFLELSRKLGILDNVTFLNYISRYELQCLYKKSIAFLFLSLEEGFGIPILEAFSASTPVICSNSTAIPEIAGDAAMLVDPLDSDDVSNAMIKFLDPMRRLQFINFGFDRLHKFSWDVVARRVVERMRESIDI